MIFVFSIVVGLFVATWMGLKIIILSEVSQRKVNII